MGVADIVRINAYVIGAEGIAAFREVRNRMVGDLKPASTLVVVAALASPAWKVEIECVAAKA
jgi:enamine deaminase RidA (YjgF/YER057c/UK114 family)